MTPPASAWVEYYTASNNANGWDRYTRSQEKGFAMASDAKDTNTPKPLAWKELYQHMQGERLQGTWESKNVALCRSRAGKPCSQPGPRGYLYHHSWPNTIPCLRMSLL